MTSNSIETGVRVRDRRFAARRLGRGAAVSVFALAVLVGGAVGALTHPPAKFRYTAEAVVVADSSPSSGRDARLEVAATLTDVFRLPVIANLVRATTNLSGDLGARMSVHTSDESDIYRIIGRAASRQEATALTNAYVLTAIPFAESLSDLERGVIKVGDFERGPITWNSPSLFAFAPSKLERVTGGAKTPRGSLEVFCPPRPGCGPSRRVVYPFRADLQYTGMAWARSRRGRPRVLLGLGGGLKDRAQTIPVRLRPSWHLLSVTWTPRRNHPFAEFTLQTANAGASAFGIDDAVLELPETMGVRPKDATASHRPARYEIAALAVSTGVVGASTFEWMLGGSALAAAVALVGIAFAWMATRHS